MNKKTIIVALLALVAITGSAQETETDSIPDGIFFRISGGGLNKPSYILGTMHTAPGDFVHFVPGFDQATDSVRQFIFERDLSDEIRQIDCLPGLDSTMMARLLWQNDSLFRYENLDSLHNPYIDDMGKDIYWHFKKMSKTLGMPDFYKYSAIENSLRLQRKYCEKVTAHSAELGYSLQRADCSPDLYVAYYIANPRGATILELDTAAVMKDVGSGLATLLSEEHDRNYYTTVFFTKAVHSFDITLRVVLRSLDNYYCHEGKKLTAPAFRSGRSEDPLLDGRNSLWMQKLPTMLQREPSMVVVGLSHLFGESGLLNSFMRLGYNIEALAPPRERIEQ